MALDDSRTLIAGDFERIRVRMPLLIWVIFCSTLLALIGNFAVLGFSVTGWGWFLPLIVSVLTILRNPGRVRFPTMVWGPWALVVAIYLLASDYPSLQRSVQLLCPVVVGMAVSTLSFDAVRLSRFMQLLRALVGGLIAVAVLKAGILLTGQLPEITGLAAEVMTGMLLSTIYAAAYAEGERRALGWWAVLAAFPVVALTRTAIVATVLTLPLTFGRMQLHRRAALLAVCLVLGTAIFYSPRVQTKMFYSGSGEMSDVLSEDFRTTGRFSMWEQFRMGIDEEPWFGHGIGSGEVFVRAITMGSAGYPHNDWLLTLYDHGIFGTAVFGLTLIAASLHALRRGRASTGDARLLLLAGAASFVPFALLMYTDNIMVYTSFFGNLQFTLLGAGYAAAPLVAGRRRVRIRW